MSEADPVQRIRDLESENARLRGLLDTTGMPSALRHQVRNALGIMRAILRRSIQGKTTIEDLVAHVEGRFDALLRVQTALLSSPDGRVDLATLVSNELMAQTIQDGEQATIDGPALRIGSREAELLGLVVHELATNAVKFGEADHIDVSWTLASPGSLTWIWAETAQTPRPQRPAFRGFGMEAIEVMLPYQLKAEGRLEFLSEGVRCTVAMPLDPHGQAMSPQG